MAWLSLTWWTVVIVLIFLALVAVAIWGCVILIHMTGAALPFVWEGLPRRLFVWEGSRVYGRGGGSLCLASRCCVLESTFVTRRLVLGVQVQAEPAGAMLRVLVLAAGAAADAVLPRDRESFVWERLSMICCGLCGRGCLIP